MANKDYYKILGVKREATEEEIKKAFRVLAHQHHPDKPGGDANKFKEINEAYQVLAHKEKRAQYDQFGSDFVNQAGGASGGFDFSGGNVNFDFGNLNDLFGGLGDMFGFGNAPRGARAPRGEDIAVDVELNLYEVAFGAERTVRLNKVAVCDSCTGSGALRGSKLSVCSHCKGRGQVTRQQHTILGTIQSVSPCPECHGRGERPEKRCPSCEGTGVRRQEENFTVKIPASIQDGEAIRLTGRGEAVAFGGRAGDLYVRVHVAPDKNLQRQGDDVRSTVSIDFVTAVLGGTTTIKTLEGVVEMKIPEGTVVGTEIRLRGRGLTRRRGAGRGDQIVTVLVSVPKKVSRAARKLLEELRSELTD